LKAQKVENMNNLFLLMRKKKRKRKGKIKMRKSGKLKENGD